MKERPPYLAYAVLSTAMLGLTGIARAYDRSLFQRFIGSADPLLVVTGAALLGAALLWVLHTRGWFSISRGNIRGVLLAAGLAAGFGLIIILADLKIVHPQDMNMPYPGSLLFYPVVGFTVEILFHVLPLALVLLVLTATFKRVQSDTLVSIGIVLVALIEPTFQAVLSASAAPLIGASHHYAWWAIGFDWVHIFLINLVQLLIFRRYDFISMYALRLSYYLIWHVVWGYVRLSVLF